MPKRFAFVALIALLVLPVGGVRADDENPLPPNPLARYVPRAPGIEEEISFLFGPFTVPPGHDLNRITLDVPMKNGFYTAVAPQLIDPLTGEEPRNQHAHIHHAHWLRITNDPTEEPYNIGVEDYTAGFHLSWVFGTGEERTQGSLNDRSDADAAPYMYGIYIKGDQPQTLIYMLHNKTSEVLNLYVALHVRFVHGTREEIRTAPDCGVGFEETETLTCRAGLDYHPLIGKLWGNTFDVPRGVSGAMPAGWYVHPLDIPDGYEGYGGAQWTGENSGKDDLGSWYTAPWDGTMIAGAGHLHPLGKEVTIANLGPKGSGCEADIDGDGLPGTTIFHSDKVEHDADADLSSEDYQMAATAAAFRAPIRKGDRITQFGVYRNNTNATYEAMSFAGMYVDAEPEARPPAVPATDCAARASYLASGSGTPLWNGGSVNVSLPNHEWHHGVDPHCGFVGLQVWPACERPDTTTTERSTTDTVHIAGFLYLPGDRSTSGLLGALPQVPAGTPLRFVNEDAAAGVRHSVTSCPWPCNGPYVANYPLPDGSFDSGKMGNIDPIDGGLDGYTSEPYGDFERYLKYTQDKFEWQTPANLTAGLYSYFCRIHPWMRGAFEVVS